MDTAQNVLIAATFLLMALAATVIAHFINQDRYKCRCCDRSQIAWLAPLDWAERDLCTPCAEIVRERALEGDRKRRHELPAWEARRS
ncbi:MAG: hypothetical protein EPO02_12875 [Nitrospirae bacterium]|nr:MAG: hypothetical protein EPO02_12875 [Nitrospirota bacterium]